MVKFFHSEHIPYAVLALSVLLILIVLPPLLLLLYPTHLLRKCLRFVGFRRWDIINHIMDIFQGQYKNGTEGTRDCRYFSALYLLLRIGLGCEFVVVQSTIDYKDIRPREWLVPGIIHVLLGMVLFTVKPYKEKWMSHVDGLIVSLVGDSLVVRLSNRFVCYIVGTGFGLLMMMLTGCYAIYKCTKECKNN